MTRQLYTAPSIETVDAHYARGSRIDTGAQDTMRTRAASALAVPENAPGSAWSTA
jgi:hypothetical protein